MSAGGLEFFVDLLDMGVYSVGTDVKGLCDFFVSQSLLNASKDLLFPRGQEVLLSGDSALKLLDYGTGDLRTHRRAAVMQCI